LGTLVERVSVGLALTGGILLLLIGGLVTASVLLRWWSSQPVPGDFELVQTGTAMVVFTFFPLCHLRGANIFVDVFTARTPARLRAGLDALWMLVYAAIAGLIAWGLALGALDTMKSHTTTMVLGLPFGWAIALTAALSAWLAVVVLLTAARALRGPSA
jgi:TRAP-type C4-dicarboxylate transport system permease small subunit